MKKTLLAVALVSTFAANAAYLDEETGETVVPENPELLGEPAQEKVNYGDPTASFKGFGLTTGSKGFKQGNFVYGSGDHIFSGDVGTSGDKDITYRARYFNIDRETNIGWSVDVLGDYKNHDGVKTSSNAFLAGGLYKMDFGNIIVAPMAYAGYATGDTQRKDEPGSKLKADSYLGQAGVYAMYGFEAGHWLYVNPKTTYAFKDKNFNNQIEVGGGFMVTDSSSLGFKSELSKYGKDKTDFLNTVNYYVYF